MLRRALPHPAVSHGFLPLAALLAVLGAGFSPGTLRPGASGVPAPVHALLAGLPPAFEALPGRPPGRAFGARKGNLALSVSATEAVVRVRSHAQAAEVRFQLPGADPDARGEGAGLLPGRTHYLLGNRPEQWQRDVPRYEKAHFTAVYPGIDAVFYGAEAGLEYDFVVHPGADPARIRIAVEGAAGAALDPAGDLVLQTAAGELRQRRPVAYQEVDGRRIPVDAEWVLGPRAGTSRLDNHGTTTSPAPKVPHPRPHTHLLSFQLGNYDATRPLIIDPILVYSSYLSGSSADSAAGVAVDENGFVYVALETHSDDMPLSHAPFQGGQAESDVYIAKLDLTRSGLSALVFGTYLGGNSSDEAGGLQVGADGSVYVGGSTFSTNFPTTAGGFQRGGSGRSDGFVTRLDPSGASLLYSTYLGGSDSDSVSGMALDETGCVYVCGSTSSSPFPVKNALQAQLRGTRDGFVVKLDPLQAGLSSLMYSTYLGGSDDEALLGMAVDRSGQAVVTGLTGSTNYPTTAGTFQAQDAPGLDGVLTRLSATGAALTYSTYLGGTGLDLGVGIALDRAGFACVALDTESSDLPVVGGFQAYQGAVDCYFARINMGAAGTAALRYSTYLGAAGREAPTSVAVDPAGNAYLTGITYSPAFPVTLQAFRAASGANAFITRIDPSRLGSASLRYSTAFGDPVGGDPFGAAGRSLAVDSRGNLYVLGNVALDTTIPITAGAFQAAPRNRFFSDAFLIAVRAAVPAVPTNLDALPLSATQTRLTWQDRSQNETGFEVHRKLGTGRFVRLRLVGKDVTHLVDTPPPGPVLYQVRAVNEEGESPFSGEVAFVAEPPTPPQNLQAFGGSSTTVDLRWTDSRREAGYRIERRFGTFAPVLLAALPANTTSFRDTSVVADTRYTYRVTAFNDLGATRVEAGVTVLAAPANLVAASVFTSSSQLRISWEDRSFLETGFELQRNQQGTGTVTSLSLGPNVTSFLDTGLARSTTYTYRVRAVAPNSLSSFSNAGSATTGRIPAAPSLIQAQATGPDRVTVSWQDNSRFEAGFRVERQDPEGPFRPAGTVPPDATTFTDQSLTPRTPYRYRVFAFNDGGDSPSSEVADVTTRNVLGGRLRFTPERLHFGVVRSGRKRELAVTVRNASAQEDLRVTARTGPGPFRVEGSAEFTLPPGGRRKLKLLFRPRAAGGAQGRLVLTSTDPQRPRARVPLSGRSYGLP